MGWGLELNSANRSVFDFRSFISRRSFVQLTDRFLVTASLGRALPDHCSKIGLDINPLLEEYKIDRNSFNSSEKFIGLNSFASLLDRVALETRSETFGIRYGLEFKLGNTGPFGFGLMNAPTLGHALKFYARYIGLMADHAYFEIETGTKSVSMNWSFSPLIKFRAQYVDLGTLLTIRQFKQFLGQQWSPHNVHLERTAPMSLTDHHHHISTRISFRNSSNSLHFSRDSLSLENPSADHRIYDIMEQQCDADLKKKKFAIPLVFKLHDEIMNRLKTGNFTLREIAQNFAMSERNLQRRLHQSGLTFEKVLDEVRKSLSDHLLSDPDLSLSEIAFLTGYSCPNSYSRAAKVWYDQSPSKEREKLDTAKTKNRA
jgi:AraC-like DNA-binding protein